MYKEQLIREALSLSTNAIEYYVSQILADRFPNKTFVEGVLDRPSRFDRKYPFDLPEPAERLAYLTLWNAALKPTLRLADEGVTKLGEITEGFSFAYLKELFLPP